MMMNIRRTAVKVATVSIVLAMFLTFLNVPMATAGTGNRVEKARSLEAFMNCVAEQKIDFDTASSQQVLRQLEVSCQAPSESVQIAKLMLAEIEKALLYRKNSRLRTKGE